MMHDYYYYYIIICNVLVGSHFLEYLNSNESVLVRCLFSSDCHFH